MYVGKAPPRTSSSERRFFLQDHHAVAVAVLFILLGTFLFGHDSGVSWESVQKVYQGSFQNNLLTGAVVLEQGAIQNSSQMANAANPLAQNETAAGAGNVTGNIQALFIGKDVGERIASDAEYILATPNSTITSVSLTGSAAGAGSVIVTFDGMTLLSVNMSANESFTNVVSGLVKGMNVALDTLKGRPVLSNETLVYTFNQSCDMTCNLSMPGGAKRLQVVVSGTAEIVIDRLHFSFLAATDITEANITLQKVNDQQLRQKQTARKLKKTLAHSALEQFRGRQVERGSDWIRDCGAGGCTIFFFSSPVHLRDVDGLYKPLTEVVTLTAVDRKTLRMRYKDYDVAIGVQNHDSSDLSNLTLNITDNVVDYEFISHYRLTSPSVKPTITVRSNKDIRADGKNIYLDDISISFEDAELFNNFNITSEKVDSKTVLVNLAKDYASFNEHIGDEIEIDPSIRLTGGNNTYDGEVDDGGTITDAKTSMQVGQTAICGGSYFRSFIDWNTTLIPDPARVTVVNLTLNVETVGDESTVHVTDMNNKSQGRAGAALYADAGVTSYASATVAAGQVSWILGYRAQQAMEKNLTIDQFNVGIKSAEDINCGVLCECAGPNTVTTIEGATVANRPLLIVTYNMPPNVTSVMVNSTDVTKNDTNQNLTVVLTGVIDIDADAVTNITDWRRNGTSLAVLNMPFNTNTSSTDAGAVFDYSTWKRNGTLGSGVAASVPLWNTTNCQRGGCYTFDGVDDFIQMPYVMNTSKKDAHTVAFWYQWVNCPSGFCTMINQAASAGDNNLYLLFDQASNRVNNYAKSYAALPSSWKDGRWHHIAYVHLANGNAGTDTFYFDGLNLTTVADTSTWVEQTTTWRIGINADNGHPFQGNMDEILIFNRSLSGHQIKLFYQNSTTLHNSTITAEVGNLFSVCVTPNDRFGDGNVTCSNNLTILAVSIPVFAPNATLIKPANATVFREVGNITLNGTISDADGDTMQFVRMYASNLSFPTATFLVQEFVNVANATSRQYNITSVPIQDENPQSTGALLIFHFDNQSDFGEPQFGRVFDFSGNGLNGTANNNIYLGRGKMAGGLDPSLGSLGVNVSNTGYLIGRKNITYLAWVNTTTLAPGSQARPIFSKHDGTNGFAIQQQKLASALQLSFDGTTITTPSFFAATNVWYHLAVVLHAAGTFEVYRDGVLFNSSTYTSITANNNHFSIGSAYSGTSHSNPFLGAIDDAAVFNRSFTAEEVNNVARLKSGTYFWYMNMTDNSTSSLNGASEIRTFIVDRVPNATSVILYPNPMNTTDTLNCTFMLSDDISSTVTAQVTFYNGSSAAETSVASSYNNGSTNSYLSLSSGLQAKNENWRCELNALRDVQGANSPGTGLNSSVVSPVNSPPNNITLLEPAHGNVTTNIRPRFRWSYVDPDNDPVNFSLQMICYNGTSSVKCPYTGDDSNLTIVASTVSDNATILAANLLYYRDDNFYYNWTVNATDGQNTTVNARPNNLSVAVVVDISTYIANVSFGTKSISDEDSTFDNTPLPIKIRNNGNARINVNLDFTDPLLFVDPTRAASTYQFLVNETGDGLTAGGFGTFNFNAINKSLSQLAPVNIVSGTYTAVRFLNFSAGSNITALHINISVPSAESQGNKNDSVTLTASYGGYI